MKKTMAKILSIVLFVTLCVGVVPGAVVAAVPELTPQTYLFKSNFNTYKETQQGSGGNYSLQLGNYFEVSQGIRFFTEATSSERMPLASTAGASGQSGDYAISVPIGASGASGNAAPAFEIIVPEKFNLTDKVVIEMDVKATQGTSLYIQHLFSAQGNFSPGSAQSTFVDSWKKLMIVLDYSNDLASIYYDGMLYAVTSCKNSRLNNGSTSSFTGYFLLYINSPGEAHFSIDNFAMYKAATSSVGEVTPPADPETAFDAETVYIKSNFNAYSKPILGSGSNYGTRLNSCFSVGDGSYGTYAVDRLPLDSVLGASGQPGDNAVSLQFGTQGMGERKDSGPYLELVLPSDADAKNQEKVVVEMDIKASAGVYLYAQHLFASDVYLYPAPSGERGKTASFAETWKKLVIELDYPNDVANIYYDGVLCGTTTCKNNRLSSGSTASYTGYFALYANTTATKGYVSIDNVVMYKPAEPVDVVLPEATATAFEADTYYFKSNLNNYTTSEGSGGTKNVSLSSCGTFSDVITDIIYSTSATAAERKPLTSVSGASGVKGDNAISLQYGGSGASGTSAPGLTVALAKEFNVADKVVIEMDVKASSGTYLYIQHLFNSHTNLAPAPGVSTSTFANEWKKLVIELDYAKDSANIYYDGVLCGTVGCATARTSTGRGGASFTGYFAIYVNAASGSEGYFSMDNIVVYKSKPEVSGESDTFVNNLLKTDFNKCTSNIAHGGSVPLDAGTYIIYEGTQNLKSVPGASGKLGDFAVEMSAASGSVNENLYFKYKEGSSHTTADRIIIETDLKVSEGTKIRLLSFAAAHFYPVYAAGTFEGNIGGATVTPGVWKKFVIVADYVADKAYIYYDGEYVGSFSGLTSAGSSRTTGTFTMRLDAPGSFAFDNFKVYEEKASRKVYIDGHFNNLATTPAQSNSNSAVLEKSLMTSSTYVNVIDYSSTAVADRNYMLRDNGASGKTGDHALKIAVSPKKAEATTYELGEGTYFAVTPLDAAKTATKLTLTADVYMTGRGKVVFQNMFNVFHTVLFDEDGKILGSDKEYALGAWKKLKIDFDYAADKAYIYYDGEYCSTISGISASAYRTTDGVSFFIRLNRTTDTGFGLSIDNLKLFEEVGSVFQVANYGFKTGVDSAATSTANYTVVKTGADTVVLNTVNALDQKSASAITLSCEGTVVESDISINGTTVSIEPKEGFVNGKIYTVTIGKNASTGGMLHNYEISRSFIVDTFDEVILSTTAGGYKLKLNTVGIAPGKYALMIAQYASLSRLTAVQRVEVDVIEGINTFEITAPTVGSEIQTIGMCWGGEDLMTPIFNISTPIEVTR